MQGLEHCHLGRRIRPRARETHASSRSCGLQHRRDDQFDLANGAEGLYGR